MTETPAPAPIPLLVYGDGPRLASGLGRIARDLLLRLVGEQETLGVMVAQVGVDPPGGWHWQAWPFWGFEPTERDQGRRAVAAAVADLHTQYQQRPIVLLIMDPSRCYDLTRTVGTPGAVDDPGAIPATVWGYFPIDAENMHGAINGPAAEAVWACDRVLGYGAYGARILHTTLTRLAADRVQASTSVAPLPFLPHGLDATFRPGLPLSAAGTPFARWRLALPGDTWILGCVATNQPRKDLSLFFTAGARLKAQGVKVGLWLHTDRLTNAWDVGQLTVDFGFQRPEVCISTSGEPLEDAQLAARYGACDATLAPGLGEGFGYPIVESLASGTPVVHGCYGGGVELLPRSDWLIAPVTYRLESCYAVKRPVFSPDDVAAALAAAAGWKRDHPALATAYCSGAVSHLRWEVLWPRWRAWIRRGVEMARQRGDATGTPTRVQRVPA